MVTTQHALHTHYTAFAILAKYNFGYYNCVTILTTVVGSNLWNVLLIRTQGFNYLIHSWNE